MVKSVIWSEPAAFDLERAVAYIYEDSPAYAIAFYNKIKEQSRTLNKFAERGRVVPENDDEHVREVFVHRYRLIYKVNDENIVIIAFVHGAQIYEK